MKYGLLLIAAIYSCLMVFASFKNDEVKMNSKFTCFSGALFVILYVIADLASYNLIFLLGLGLLFLIFSCIMNGISLYGKIHLTHHLVRIVVSSIMVTLLYYYG